MDQPCELDEAVLLDYVLGAAPAELRSRIEGSPACRAAAESLARSLSLLYRFECPDAELLVAYGERRIVDSTLDLVLHAHSAACLHCREELALLDAIDKLPLSPRPELLRRIILAEYRPQLAQALRGDTLQYQAEQLSVSLRIRPELGGRGRWTVRGQLRGADGALAAGLLQAVSLQRTDWPEPAAGAVEAGAAFRLGNLEAGTYLLAIDTPDQTINIPNLVIGTP